MRSLIDQYLFHAETKDVCEVEREMGRQGYDGVNVAAHDSEIAPDRSRLEDDSVRRSRAFLLENKNRV